MRAKRRREPLRGIAVEQPPGEHEAFANEEEEGQAGRRHPGQFGTGAKFIQGWRNTTAPANQRNPVGESTRSNR